ncbi:MAG: hypothetical protein ACI4FO_09365 [Acutalibacteraceae bacterium]
MNDNKKLICAAAGAIGALVAVSATVFAVKQHKKKKNAMLLEELDCCLDDDIAELASEAEEPASDCETCEAEEEPDAEEDAQAEPEEEKAYEPAPEEKEEKEAEEAEQNEE